MSIARDKGGDIKASQVIYLDKEGKRRKDIEVSKRTKGVLKGSYVELTKNKEAKEVYIAEGIETALSIASVEREARVICSLGVVNMRNIELNNISGIVNKNKNIIICADNDGENAGSISSIEEGIKKFKDQGVSCVCNEARCSRAGF